VPRAPPGSRNKPKLLAVGAPRAGGPLRTGAPAQGMENRATVGASRTLTLRVPAMGGALAAMSPLVAAMPGALIGRSERQGPFWAPFPRLQTPRCRRRRHPS
jgi:hypothetical protein